MKNKLIILLLSITPYCFCQQVVATSGSSAIANNLVLDWTFGEPLINTLAYDNYVLTQGMHQSNLLVTSIYNAEIIDMEMKAFPIPTSDILSLVTQDKNIEGLSFKLYDLEGRILLTKNLVSNHTRISLNDYQPAVYLLQVYYKSALIQSFKIVKH